MNGQLEFAKLVASRLDSARIPYMITGSMALAIYAVPRMTRDVDFVIECRPEDSERVAELFEADCYVDREAVRDAAVTRSAFNVIHNASLLKADFIVRKDEKYRKIEFERRRRIDIEGTLLSVVAPEDLASVGCSSTRGGSAERGEALMSDTSPDVAARYEAMILAQTPARRLAMASEMFATAKALAIAGIRLERGDLERRALREALFLRLHGDDFTESQIRDILKHLRVSWAEDGGAG